MKWDFNASNNECLCLFMLSLPAYRSGVMQMQSFRRVWHNTIQVCAYVNDLYLVSLMYASHDCIWCKQCICSFDLCIYVYTIYFLFYIEVHLITCAYFPASLCVSIPGHFSTYHISYIIVLMRPSSTLIQLTLTHVPCKVHNDFWEVIGSGIWWVVSFLGWGFLVQL